MIKVIASLLAGYGLFLVGLKEFTHLLNQATSESFEKILKRATKRPVVNALAGILVGLFTVGNIILSVCIAGAAHSLNIINKRKTLVLVNFSRLGACLYVFLAGFNLNLFILCALGLSGISYAIQKPKNWQKLMPLLFQLAVVLFGIQLIKTSADLLDDNPVMAQILALTQVYPYLAFLAGFVVMFISQSFFASMVICISFVGSEVFSLEEAVLCTCGIYFSLAITRYFYLFAFKKSFKMAMSFVPYYYFLCSFLIFIFYLFQEYYIPVFAFFIPSASKIDPKIHLSIINFIIHLITTFSLAPLLPIFLDKKSLMSKLKLGTVESFPKELLQHPTFSLEYLEKKYIESMQNIKNLLEKHLSEKAKEEKENLRKKIFAKNRNSLQELERLLSQLSSENFQDSFKVQLLVQGEKLSLLHLLADNIQQFCQLAQQLNLRLKDESAALKIQNMGEAIHSILSCALDALKAPSPENLHILKKISQERNAIFFKEEKDLSEQVSKNSYFEIIELFQVFQSSLWLLTQLEKKYSFENQFLMKNN
jgi:Na+/phosphate symporter